MDTWPKNFNYAAYLIDDVLRELPREARTYASQGNITKMVDTLEKYMDRENYFGLNLARGDEFPEILQSGYYNRLCTNLHYTIFKPEGDFVPHDPSSIFIPEDPEMIWLKRNPNPMETLELAKYCAERLVPGSHNPARTKDKDFDIAFSLRMMPHNIDQQLAFKSEDYMLRMKSLASEISDITKDYLPQNFLFRVKLNLNEIKSHMQETYDLVTEQYITF